MRTLCSLHVFEEVAPDVYANNHTSAALINNEPLRAYILLLFVPFFPNLNPTNNQKCTRRLLRRRPPAQNPLSPRKGEIVFSLRDSVAGCAGNR